MDFMQSEMDSTTQWIISNQHQNYQTFNNPVHQAHLAPDTSPVQDYSDSYSITDRLIPQEYSTEEKEMNENVETMTDKTPARTPEERAKIDKCLRIIQVAMFCSCIVFGLMVALSVGWAWKVNQYKCPLYAQVSLSVDTINNTILLQTTKSQWGSDSTCNFCTYHAVIACIYGMIWMWFYILTSDWDFYHLNNRIPPDLRLLPTALIFSFPLLISSVIAAGLTSSGYSSWCSSVTNALVSSGLSDPSCGTSRHLGWTPTPDTRSTYTYFEWAVSGSWLLMFSLLVIVIVSFLRMSQNLNVIFIEEDEDFTDMLDELSTEIITKPASMAANTRTLSSIPENEGYLPLGGTVVPEYKTDGDMGSYSDPEQQTPVTNNVRSQVGSGLMHRQNALDQLQSSLEHSQDDGLLLGASASTFTMDSTTSGYTSEEQSQVTRRMKYYVPDQ